MALEYDRDSGEENINAQIGGIRLSYEGNEYYQSVMINDRTGDYIEFDMDELPALIDWLNENFEVVDTEDDDDE